MGGVTLGGNIKTFATSKILSKEKTNAGILYQYATKQVIVDNNDQIVNIVSDNPQVVTGRGIHVTSTVADIIQKYGPNYQKNTYNELDLYEYEMPTSNHSKKILRFAVDPKTNTISYISSRLVAD